MTPLSLEADQNYPRQVRSPIIMKFVFELYRETDKLWPKTSLFWFERTLRQVLVFICKVINIAADCFCRNCPRNGSRGCQAIPQSRWHQSGRGEKRLEHHHLCSEDEHNRLEGAGDAQTPKEKQALSETRIRRSLSRSRQVKEQESVPTTEWTETSHWFVKGRRHFLCQEKRNILWSNNVIRSVRSYFD